MARDSLVAETLQGGLKQKAVRLQDQPSTSVPTFRQVPVTVPKTQPL